MLMLFLFVFSCGANSKCTNSVSPTISHFWCNIKRVHFGQYLVHKTPKKHVLKQKLTNAKMQFHSYTCYDSAKRCNDKGCRFF